uniref:Uncharacterized protein n=1 Tax=Arundo donax TaxID=35708 RepID=A0A0A8Y3J2_ARUDO
MPTSAPCATGFTLNSPASRLTPGNSPRRWRSLARSAGSRPCNRRR